MKSWISRLFGRKTTTARKPARARLGLESLDQRLTPTVTDMTAMSLYFPTHNGPTNVYLNFDGCSNLNGHNVSPYTGTAAQKADLLYRVSEVFAPFNVRVQQARGAGLYVQGGGATTVFVGDDTAFNRWVDSADGTSKRLNGQGAETPPASMDTPYAVTPDHAPNSDPFDLAFADPLGQRSVTEGLWLWDTTQTAQAIAHEVGHTFGLAHVLGQSMTATVNDVMSYNSTNAFFANTALPITTLNYSPATGTTGPDASKQPVFTDPADGKKADVTTQNSFTFLGSMLGYRPAHEPRVIHRDAVDTGVYSRFSATYVSTLNQGVGLGFGDYRAYHLKADAPAFANGWFDIQVRATGAPDAVALLYRAGQPVQLLPGTAANGEFDAAARLRFDSGEEFDLVVGGASFDGRYQVSFNPAAIAVDSTGAVAPAGSTWLAGTTYASSVGGATVVGTSTTLYSNTGYLQLVGSTTTTRSLALTGSVVGAAAEAAPLPAAVAKVTGLSDPAATAARLDRDLGLYPTGNVWLNWGGRQEKWLAGGGGAQFFVTPTGDLYRWDGSATAGGTWLARLGPTYYSDLSLVYDAATDRTFSASAADLDRNLGLTALADVRLNWGGRQEKWLAGSGGAQYFITPTGDLYLWDGDTSGALHGAWMGRVDVCYYTDVASLCRAGSLKSAFDLG